MRKLLSFVLAVTVALATMIVVPLSLGKGTANAGSCIPHQKHQKYNSTGSKDC